MNWLGAHFSLICLSLAVVMACKYLAILSATCFRKTVSVMVLLTVIFMLMVSQMLIDSTASRFMVGMRFKTLIKRKDAFFRNKNKLFKINRAFILRVCQFILGGIN